MKPKIKDLPNAVRPREKLAARGAPALTDAELLAIILGSGIPGRNVKKVAESILARFGDRLCNVDCAELQKVPGVGRVKAGQIVAGFELCKRFLDLRDGRPEISSAQDVVLLCQNLLTAKVEHLVVLFLDARKRLIEKREIARGTVDASLIHPREVLAPALELRATAIIIAHNHPSGDSEPSYQDREITFQLQKACELMGIEFLDHLVLARGGTSSVL